MACMPGRLQKSIKSFANSDKFHQNPCFYLYDLSKIKSQIKKLEEALPSFCHLYYAMKANPHGRVLEFLKQFPLIKGIEIASSGELVTARESFPGSQIIFTGPGKTDYELAQALQVGIRQIHVESLTEAIRLDRMVKRLGQSPIPVLIRINVNHTLQGAHNCAVGASSKFGIDEDQIVPQTREIMKLTGLKVRGFHLFAGSGVMESHHFIAYLKHVFDLAKQLNQRDLPTEVLDMGGGFGIDYRGEGRELNIHEVGAAIAKFREECGNTVKEFILELGRYIVGEAGHYITEIIDIKESRGKKHIITAGGINHQRRPMAQGINHPISIIPRNHTSPLPQAPQVYEEKVDIGGPLCTKVDYLAKDYPIAQAKIGDLVVIHCSGAYGLSFGHVNFLGHPLPKEHFVDLSYATLPLQNFSPLVLDARAG